MLAACQACAAAAQFTVLCAVSAAAHHDEQPSSYGAACFGGLAAAWQRQLNEQRRAAGQGPCSLAILHCPLLLCPLSNTAFVLPAASAAAALPRVGKEPAGYSTSAPAAAGDSDDEHPGPPPPSAAAASSGRHSSGSGAPAAGLSLLAHALMDAAAVLGCRPEAFSLGPCARRVVQAMAFVPAPPGNAPPAALVLVDRLMDPVSPAQHPDLLVQRMLSALSTLPAAGGDAACGADSGSGGGGAAVLAPLCAQVPMPSLDAPPAAAGEAAGAPAGGASPSAAAADEDRGPPSMLPGSLRHPDDPQARRPLRSPPRPNLPAARGAAHVLSCPAGARNPHPPGRPRLLM